MYFLETVNNNVWISPALVGAAIALGIWLFKGLAEKYVKSIESRLEHGEEEVEEVKRNYNRKFQEVHEKIDRTKEIIIDRIDRMNTDQMTWRMQASKDTATIQNDIKHLADTINRNNDGRNTRS